MLPSPLARILESQSWIVTQIHLRAASSLKNHPPCRLWSIPYNPHETPQKTSDIAILRLARRPDPINLPFLRRTVHTYYLDSIALDLLAFLLNCSADISKPSIPFAFALELRPFPFLRRFSFPWLLAYNISQISASFSSGSLDNSSFISHLTGKQETTSFFFYYHSGNPPCTPSTPRTNHPASPHQCALVTSKRNNRWHHSVSTSLLFGIWGSAPAPAQTILQDRQDSARTRDGSNSKLTFFPSPSSDSAGSESCQIRFPPLEQAAAV
ncbi:hypothetical protein QBC33DRAFT_525110 [Phialemonium atrogriseum]|uniref:Uncharacterized protein n=1 Tax=Phialemonium atrogriseum TaxID=1093897 RepID=A0AAJ0C995_9PEZI|nr:uncharacterized protein QBC33DRAFT_525110 [Phialemonium atrogriseum]KAK1771887.1 hypothetical protein QBC33DRAFT_525110 [Phialemonium atrogriseum]